MERLQGRTLAELMSDFTFAADVPTRVDLIAQLCVGLHHAHEQQLVHGNLRPEHVFVTDDGVTKILNFGATPSANDRTIVSDNALAGSFEYMSPEQIIGRDAIDGRSDVFSAGVLLYEFVSGRRPFQGGSTPATLARILRDDPPPLEGLDRLNTILRRALEKEPAKRFGSAQEFAYALWMMDLPVAPTEDEEDEAQAAGSETMYADAARDSAQDDDTDEEAAVGSRFPVSPQTLLYATIALAVVIVSAVAVVSC
jgi:serine/threonine protein kinase